MDSVNSTQCTLPELYIVPDLARGALIHPNALCASQLAMVHYHILATAQVIDDEFIADVPVVYGMREIASK